MLCFLVPGPVPSLTVVERGSHHFRVKWHAPYEPNGIIVGFVVGVRRGRNCPVYRGLYHIVPNSRLSSDPSFLIFGSFVWPSPSFPTFSLNFLVIPIFCVLRHQFCHEHKNAPNIGNFCGEYPKRPKFCHDFFTK